MGAAYVGLRTGAGAAGGLETLLARMRADEQLAQHQQQLDQSKMYQDRTLTMQERGATRADEAAAIANETARTKINMLRRIVGDGDAGNASSTGASGQIQLIRPPADNASVVPEEPPAPTGVERFNNPTGRTQFQIAGLNPNESFGSVQQPPKPKGPEDYNEQETFFNKWAREKVGVDSYKDPAFPASEMEKARKAWAEQGRIFSPAQLSEPVVQIDDPDNPGSNVYTPRSLATGKRGPLPAGQKDKLQAYDTTLSMVDAIERLGDEIGWKGLGPIRGRVGRIGMEYLGVGDPREEQLRNLIDNLRTQASFQEGGKTLTGTESQLLNAFLTGVNQNPTAAKARLKMFKEQALRSKASLSGPVGTDPGASTTPGGGGDAYSEYLKRTQRKPGGGQ